MAAIYFRADPFNKSDVTLALESGVDAVIVPEDKKSLVAGLARGQVFTLEEMPLHSITSKADEEDALAKLKAGVKIVLQDGWEVIPVENLLAQSDQVLAETPNLERARLACGILEKGVAGIVVAASAINELKAIVAQCKLAQIHENLVAARITRVERSGMGHRVCLDTMTIMQRGQGVLVGNSSAFTFLVHAETEHNEYVASRPFRINAGAAHAYIVLPGNRTSYLSELRAGSELLIVDYKGESSLAILGRVKMEVRPMLLIEAEVDNADGTVTRGTVFLQNAETIRLTSPAGLPLSVVSLSPGDEVLCKLEQAGRHFGMSVKEEIQEV